MSADPIVKTSDLPVELPVSSDRTKSKTTGSQQEVGQSYQDRMSPVPIKSGLPELNLSQLAKAIQDAYIAAGEGITAEKMAAQYTVQAAVTCGAYLRQAKAKLPHGQLLPWVRQEAKVPVRTAQNYMRLHQWVLAHSGEILKHKPHNLRQMYILAGILPEDETKKLPGENADELAKLKRMAKRLCLEAASHRDYSTSKELLRALVPVRNLLDDLDEEQNTKQSFAFR